MYGRARRIQALKILFLVVAIIVVIFISGTIFYNIFVKEDDNVDYAYLAKYLKNKGYTCELLKYNGSSCKLDGAGTYNMFTRYDDGFEYTILTDSYYIAIVHVKDLEEFSIKTNEKAFSGYKNKKYYCKFKDSLIGDLDKCTDEDNNSLDMEIYKGAVESAMNDLNNILNSSGYKVEELLKNYKWVK